MQCTLSKENENMNHLRSLTELLPAINMESMIAFDALDMVIYISDMETYEILYVNKYTQDIFGDVEGQLCYKVFQGFDKPCRFCTNGRIKDLHGEAYKWVYNNEITGRKYLIKDKVIRWLDGRKVRLEIAIDITDVTECNSLCKEGDDYVTA